MTSKQRITIPATEFKASCLALMDRVQASGLTITITKHGKTLGSLPVTIVGDIVRPTDQTWDADR